MSFRVVLKWLPFINITDGRTFLFSISLSAGVTIPRGGFRVSTPSSYNVFRLSSDHGIPSHVFFGSRFLNIDSDSTRFHLNDKQLKKGRFTNGRVCYMLNSHRGRVCLTYHSPSNYFLCRPRSICYFEIDYCNLPGNTNDPLSGPRWPLATRLCGC